MNCNDSKKEKSKWKKEIEKQKMYTVYVRETPLTTDENKTWERLRKSDLKVATEALICAAQELTLRTNHVKCNINKKKDSAGYVATEWRLYVRL